MSLECPGATFRRQCWLDAGSPIADLHRLQYAGADTVRWILERTLRRLPPDVAWFSVEAIDWIEVGRDAHAWAHHAPAPRALAGDIPHRITICGRVSDKALPGLIVHEVSHRLRKPVTAEVPPPQPLATVDMLGLTIYGELRAHALTEEQLAYARAVYVGRRVAEEMRADQQAREWGFDWPGHDYDELRRRFGAQYDEARRLARLAADADADIAACTAAIEERRG